MSSPRAGRRVGRACAARPMSTQLGSVGPGRASRTDWFGGGCRGGTRPRLSASGVCSSATSDGLAREKSSIWPSTLALQKQFFCWSFPARGPSRSLAWIVVARRRLRKRTPVRVEVSRGRRVPRRGAPSAPRPRGWGELTTVCVAFSTHRLAPRFHNRKPQFPEGPQPSTAAPSRPSAAAWSVAMSSLRILSIASIARRARSGSRSANSSSMPAGVTCQDSP
jgi:hypothetical protein